MLQGLTVYKWSGFDLPSPSARPSGKVEPALFEKWETTCPSSLRNLLKITGCVGGAVAFRSSGPFLILLLLHRTAPWHPMLLLVSRKPPKSSNWVNRAQHLGIGYSWPHRKWAPEFRLEKGISGCHDQSGSAEGCADPLPCTWHYALLYGVLDFKRDIKVVIGLNLPGLWNHQICCHYTSVAHGPVHLNLAVTFRCAVGTQRRQPQWWADCIGERLWERSDMSWTVRMGWVSRRKESTSLRPPVSSKAEAQSRKLPSFLLRNKTGPTNEM